MSIQIQPAGDRAAIVEVPDNAAAVRLAQLLQSECDGLVDVVPGHCTVLATWTGAPPDLRAFAESSLGGTAQPEGRLVEIAVRYDGPDLDEVAQLTGLSPEEVVARHTGAETAVAFLGFQPGFAYLLGIDPRLVVPRRETPRTQVPGGSVAIAGPYSGVYPRESPGGWRLLGSTTATMFDAARTPPALLGLGDRVRFVAA